MAEEIRLPAASSAGLYVGFYPTQERIARGVKVKLCGRCKRIVGHWPKDSFGHEVICLSCGNDIPAIRARIDQLAKARGE